MTAELSMITTRNRRSRREAEVVVGKDLLRRPGVPIRLRAHESLQLLYLGHETRGLMTPSYCRQIVPQGGNDGRRQTFACFGCQLVRQPLGGGILDVECHRQIWKNGMVEYYHAFHHSSIV